MWFCVVLCGSVWFCVVLCGFVWFCVVLCGSVWFCVVLCGFVWFCVVLKLISDINGGTETEGEECCILGCYAMWLL
jgi:hypothetical protein